MKEKRLFSMEKFEIQKNNLINKFYFFPNLFSYRFEPNFQKWCDSNKSRFIFLGKRFSTTWPFLIFEIELIITKYSNLFIKILFWKIVFFIILAIKEFTFKNWKRSNCREPFSKKMKRDLLESHHFLKFSSKR